ncbi:hypothetical protein SAMN05660330_03516 [Desulforhopalus singaporensis]|uniref:Uncharacterized protein n=1 Tax=Desulforhopalus singaporensis TaxID=91360 RepID=A0A1H0UEH4_9BACT|nr:hypothetical protein SAMN05660330_03516 [Desulforhopalus singaporensis]
MKYSYAPTKQPTYSMAAEGVINCNKNRNVSCPSSQRKRLKKPICYANCTRGDSEEKTTAITDYLRTKRAKYSLT